MNIQVPFDVLGHYDSIALNTDDTFYQLTIRYQCANITITLNKHDIESYNFRIVTIEGKLKVKEVLPKLIEYFEKLGHKDTYRKRETWKI